MEGRSFRLPVGRGQPGAARLLGEVVREPAQGGLGVETATTCGADDAEQQNAEQMLVELVGKLWLIDLERAARP